MIREFWRCLILRAWGATAFLCSVGFGGPDVHPVNCIHAILTESFGVYSIDGASTVVDGTAVDFTPLEYLPPDAGQSPRAMAEKILGMSLGPQIGAGGYRDVYRASGLPGRVVKIFDHVRREKEPAVIIQIIQRELALERFLLNQGYPVVGLERDMRLLRRGIFLQREITGQRVRDFGISDPRVRRLRSRIIFHDPLLISLVRERFGMEIVSRIYRGVKERVAVGVDLGDELENIIDLGPEGLALIDW